MFKSRLCLARGNHDRLSIVYYQQLEITLAPDPYIINHNSVLRLIFSYRPTHLLEPGMLNLHGHIHNNPDPELGARHIRKNG